VIPAAKITGIATLFLANGGAAMHTAVHQHVNAAVLVARHNRRLGADSDGLVIAGSGDFAFMADEDPGAFEDSLHFGFEDFSFGIDFPMDTLILDEFVEIQLRRHGLPRL
jgi:hypothetical protein